jgi:surface antigen
MAKLTAELLSAYHDQELALEEVDRLRLGLAEDGEARALLESFGRTDDAVRAAFAGDLDAPVSLALARSVRTGFVARKRRAVGRAMLHWAGPMAAAIAVVVFGDHWIEQRTESAIAEREAQIAALADRAVQDALEHAVSGAEISVADEKLAGVVSITPTRTYRSESQHWCREFVENVMIEGLETKRFGLACREASGGWRRVQTSLPGSKPPPVGQVL